MDTKVQNVAALYDKRAPQYDSESSFHHTQHADYCAWLAVTPGLSILDLACGTGGITIPLSHSVNSTGKVFGVDVSSASLAIARSKATQQNLDITFIHHDISNLDQISALHGQTFDVITCAAAFVLLPDPGASVKNWAKYLKPGGKLMLDTPTRDTMVPGYILEEVGLELEIPISLFYGRTNLDTVEKVKRILDDAGLDSSGSFVTRSYEQNEYEIEDAGPTFDKFVGRKGWLDGVFGKFERDGVKDVARARYEEKFKERANEQGVVVESLCFNMGVGVKLL